MFSASPDVAADLAERLREYRRREILTQAELAEQLGVPLRTLQTWEYGRLPQPARRRRILAFLDEREVAA